MELIKNDELVQEVIKNEVTVQEVIKNEQSVQEIINVLRDKRNERIRKEKSIRRVVLLSILFILSMSILSFATDIPGKIQLRNEKELNSILEKYEVSEECISMGDTAWTIQEKLAPNADVRELLYWDGQINGRSVGNIKAGDIVKFLIPKTK